MGQPIHQLSIKIDRIVESAARSPRKLLYFYKRRKTSTKSLNMNLVLRIGITIAFLFLMRLTGLAQKIDSLKKEFLKK